MCSLDEYFHSMADHIHLVKIDVEGAELKVLRGMRSLMNQSPYMSLILEFYPRLLRMADGDYAPIELLSLLRESGFHIWEIRDDGEVVDLKNYGSFEDFIYSVRKLTNLLVRRSPW